VQNSGTLGATPLENILETIQKDRATGTLRLHGPEGDATLFFLFGHLFHATDAERQGEPVVYDALGWQEGDFTFDSKAKLPAEETIKISTAELLANRAAGSTAAPPPQATDEEAAAKAAATEVLAEAEKVGIGSPEAAPAPAAEPEPVAAPVAEAAMAPEAAPAPDAAPAPEAAAEAKAVPAPVAVAASQGDTPKRRRTDKRPGTRPPETMELYPVPPGDMIYESLTAAFVDFPKLLRSLSKDQHSGYVRLTGEGFKAVLLFSTGAVVEAIYDGRGQVRTGVDAFHLFGTDIDNSEGSLDVIRLTPEMVTAIYQLLTAPGLYDKLKARFVKVDQLLEHLSEEGTSGAVIMRLERQTGVVLYRNGTILGCYTDSDPTIDSDLNKVLAICSDDTTAIEVRGGPLPDALPVLQPGDSGQTTVPSGSSSTVEAAARTPHLVEAPAAEPALPPVVAAEPVVLPPFEAADQPAPEAAVSSELVGVPPVPAYAAASPTSPSDLNGAESGGDTADVDWATIISAMAGRADAVLGTRSKKVKELLYAAGHNRQDVDGTIERISELSIMFVDPSKLTALAADMRQIAASAH
jgi:hypothetical protein